MKLPIKTRTLGLIALGLWIVGLIWAILPLIVSSSEFGISETLKVLSQNPEILSEQIGRLIGSSVSLIPIYWSLEVKNKDSLKFKIGRYWCLLQIIVSIIFFSIGFFGVILE